MRSKASEMPPDSQRVVPAATAHNVEKEKLPSNHVPPYPEPAARLREVVEKANLGDQVALVELRAMLDTFPQIWRHCGNLAKAAELAWINLFAGDDALQRETVQRYLAAMKAELLGAKPTVVERLLADEICLSYLAKHHAEQAAAYPDKASVAQAAFRVRRLEITHRRFLRAVKLLAQIRALGLGGPSAEKAVGGLLRVPAKPEEGLSASSPDAAKQYRQHVEARLGG
jgi:hypothetical protein